MDRVRPLLSRYRDLLARYLLAGDDIGREEVLGEASELAKLALGDGPAVDQMIELHTLAQAGVAQAWQGSDASREERAARERMVRGEATALMLALMMPHELEQRAHHERRWRREHETLTAMFEQTDELIVILDAEGFVDDVNPAFCRATGWSRLEAVAGAASWHADLGALSERQGRASVPMRGGGMLLGEWSTSTIQGNRGQVLSRVCLGRDVTRREQIEQGLRENDKLRAVATLAAGIAHDFNNLLGSILGLAELCEIQAEPASRMARNLSRIREAGAKASTLVRQMLDFSRQTPTTMQRRTGAELLAHAGQLLRAAMPPNVWLRLQVDVDGAVDLDLVQMEQVLLNMTRNAAHAMRERDGAISIVVDRAAPSGRDAPHLRLQVIDEGDGIPPEQLCKIFDPFFTTKPVGEGTGLGLSAAHGIVSNHGGTIEVHSRVGIGTTFSIFLPLAESAEMPKVKVSSADTEATDGSSFPG